jgi:hypothetical protein
MASERTSERAFFGVSALLFAASAAATIVWCASMSAMGGMLGPRLSAGAFGIGFWVTLGERCSLALERAQRLFECLTESFVLCQRLVQTALSSISVLAQEADFLFDFLNSVGLVASVWRFHPAHHNRTRGICPAV